MRAIWSPCALIAAFLGQVDTTQYTFPPASWVKVNSDTSTFTARNGHGAVVFNDELWVVGGRGESYSFYNLESTNRRGDVWHSNDYGATWTQETSLTGDFYVQNFDAPNPGSLAPWYARFGHTLDVVTATDRAGDDAELMVLTGGFTPAPSNDVWVTADGAHWRYVHHANWTARAWHASAVLDGKLFVLGGTPLNNEVWAADPFWQAANGAWHSSWSLVAAADAVPWSPRAALAAAVLPGLEPPDGNGTKLFIAGGFGGWTSADDRYDGIRSRNDVWVSADGAAWQCASGAAPWDPRAWHGLVAWSNFSDPYTDVSGAPSATDADGSVVAGVGPRLWLAGGGYSGFEGNRDVTTMEGYVDVWWSYDGARWVQVNYEEGSGDDLYSSMEWAVAETDSGSAYVGKWGHRLVPWRRRSSSSTSGAATLPALYLIAGDTVSTGALVKDVFKSNDTLLCSIRGVVCNDAGDCVDGGVCECAKGVSGDFCTEGSAGGTSAAPRKHSSGSTLRPLFVAAALISLALADRLPL